MTGSAALPRKNGELVFQSPWESKTFGMAIALHEKGFYEWDEFREALIAEIKRWESRSTAKDRKWNYYERWLSSLEEVLVKKGIVSRKELDRRAREFEKGLRNHRH
jgi:nitrile hydratase accessory protein